MYLLLPCRVLQHITIRKEEEEVHTAIEAGLPDEDIGKLARISHRVRKDPLICWCCFTWADSRRPLQTTADPRPQFRSRLDTGPGHVCPQLVSALQDRALSIEGHHNPCEDTLGLVRRRTRR